MRIRFVVAAACCISLAGCAAGGTGGSTQESSTAEQSVDWTSDVRAVEISDISDPQDFEGQLDRAVSLGFTAIRIPLDWSRIEMQKGVFDWRDIDAAVGAARVRGIAVMASVENSPAWARDPRYARAVTAPPRDPADLQAFLAVAAKRLGSGIGGWEIFPGANTAGVFVPNVDAQRMCGLLRAAHTAIKAVDPNATVVSGSTTQVADSARSISPARFVQQLFLCGKGQFDAVGMNPSGPGVITSSFGPGGAGQQINATRQVMVLNGASDQKIMFLGFGVPTQPGGVDENTQATYLVTGLDYLRSRDFAATTFVSEFQDVKTGSSNPADNLGLTRSDGAGKPSLGAVTAMRG